MRALNGKLTKVAALALLAIALILSAADSRAQDSRKVISRPAPVYPDAAKRLLLSGTVKVQLVIAPDGHIKEVKVLGGHPLLVEAVEDALKNWKYEPAKTDSAILLEFNFHP